MANRGRTIERRCNLLFGTPPGDRNQQTALMTNEKTQITVSYMRFSSTVKNRRFVDLGRQGAC
jgi:hypothetical protein